MRFLEQNAFLHAEFGDIYRKDVWSIPMAPLREFVTNALVHQLWQAFHNWITRSRSKTLVG